MLASNEVILLRHLSKKYQYLLVRKYVFASLLLLYFGEVKKFKVILEAKSAMSRLVRLTFT